MSRSEVATERTINERPSAALSADVRRLAAVRGRPTAMFRTETMGLAVDAVQNSDAVVALTEWHMHAAEPFLVTFVNPHSPAVARQRPGFRGQLDRFDAVLPDGIGMSIAVRLIHRLPAARVSFDMTSLAPAILALAAAGGRTVVLVGGVPGCAESAAARLRTEFHGLNVAATFDGFGTIAERAAEIAALAPDLVLCGMGAVKQEALLLELAGLGWRGCGFTCGGFLDQTSLRLSYYPAWVDRLQLRWAYRLASEPRRLWRRYLLTYPPFVVGLAWAVVAERLRLQRPVRTTSASDRAELEAS